MRIEIVARVAAERDVDVRRANPPGLDLDERRCDRQGSGLGHDLGCTRSPRDAEAQQEEGWDCGLHGLVSP